MKLHQYRFNVFPPLMTWIDDKVDLSFGCLSRPDRKIIELRGISKQICMQKRYIENMGRKV